MVPTTGSRAHRAGLAAGLVQRSVPPRRPLCTQGRPRRRYRNADDRQTRTVEKTVKVPIYEFRNPYAPITTIVHLDEHDLVLHVLTDPALLTKILDSFAAGPGPRLNGRQLTGPLHEVRAPLLENDHDHVTPPPPKALVSARRRRCHRGSNDARNSACTPRTTAPDSLGRTPTACLLGGALSSASVAGRSRSGRAYTVGTLRRGRPTFPA